MHNSLIFVFGSNKLGIHGAGSALFAKNNYGAIQGQGYGLQGHSFAIPTKETPYKSLPLEEINKYVNMFLSYARDNSDKKFFVSSIGCGLAGYKVKDIAPMFKNITDNIILNTEFKDFIKGE